MSRREAGAALDSGPARSIGTGADQCIYPGPPAGPSGEQYVSAAFGRFRRYDGIRFAGRATLTSGRSYVTLALLKEFRDTL
jgi:hypothetical protein